MRGKAGNVGSQALLHDVVPAPDVQPRQPLEEDRSEGVRGEAHGGSDQAAEHREKVSFSCFVCFFKLSATQSDVSLLVFVLFYSHLLK